MEKNKGLKWKRDYGDGEVTDDLVLWYKGNPLDIVISGAIGGWFGELYLGSSVVYTADSRKELKAFFEEDDQCQRFLKSEIAAYEGGR